MNIIRSCPGNKRQREPEGIDADLMREMIGERNNLAVTNEDCIAVVYNYAPDDDLSVPDEEYYRWCEPPTDKDELYRRYSFRRRRVDYFRRPAIYHNNKWYPEKYLPDPEDPEWSWKEGMKVDRPAQSAYQLSKGQVFWDPDRYKRNVGDHPHYKFKWHFDQIDKDVPPDPIKHLKRPTEIGARFPVDEYPWSEYKPSPKYIPNYHPDWKGWRVSDPVMINLTNRRKTYMGEVRPDTSAPIFQPLMGQGWIKEFDENDMEPAPITSAQSSGQIPAHLKDLRPYITPQEMRARDWRETSMPGISDIKTWGQLRPRESLTINQWQGTQMSTTSVINNEEYESKAPNPNYKIPKKQRKSLQSSTLKDLVEGYVDAPVIPAKPKSNLSQIINKAKKEREERDKAPKRSKRVTTPSVEQEVEEIKTNAPLASIETEAEEDAQAKQQPEAAKKKPAKVKGKKKN